MNNDWIDATKCARELIKTAPMQYNNANSSQACEISDKTCQFVRQHMVISDQRSPTTRGLMPSTSRHRMLTKLFPQNKQHCTVSRSWITNAPRASAGSQFIWSSFVFDGARNAFRLHPIQLRTIGVDRMNDVIEHLPTIYLSTCIFVELITGYPNYDLCYKQRQWCLQVELLSYTRGIFPRTHGLSRRWQIASVLRLWCRLGRPEV